MNVFLRPRVSPPKRVIDSTVDSIRESALVGILKQNLLPSPSSATQPFANTSRFRRH
jgi:hypothetical protein